MAGSITSLFASSPAGGIAGGSASGTAIATLSHTALTQKGNYRLKVYVSIGTGVGANDGGNMVVNVGSSNYIVPVAAVSGAAGPYELTVNLDGATDVILKVGSNASVGVYYGSMTAEFVGMGR